MIADQSQPPQFSNKSLEVHFGDFKIRWTVLIAYFLIHFGAITALFHFTWTGFLSFLILYMLTAMLGITVGYHRLISHQSFKTFPWVMRFHATLGSLAMQLGPLTWANLHRAHHAFSDKVQDPHAQQFGFFFGHIGWSFLAHKSIGRSSLLKKPLPKIFSGDPYLIWLDRNYFWLITTSLVVLYLLGGLPLLLWGGAFRIAWTLHATWFVNSVCHRWGYRLFESSDESRNNWVVAILAWGEGWHNNHHKFPNSARQGLKWWEVDPTWIYLNMLKALGLVWDLKTPANYAPEPLGPTQQKL